MNNIYIAWAEDCDLPPRYLGTFTGNSIDIEAFVKANYNIGYGLKLDLVKPVRVIEGTAAKIRNLLTEKAKLEKRLKEINREITT